MVKIKSFSVLFFLLFIPFSGYGDTSKSSSNNNNETYTYNEESSFKIFPKVCRDLTNLKKCGELTENDFQETSLPYFPGVYNGTLWLDVDVVKPKNSNGLPTTLVIESDYIDFNEAYVHINDYWQEIKIKTDISGITDTPLIPILNNFYENVDVVHIRISLRSTKGNPVNLKLVPNSDLFKTSTRALSRFCLSGGIGICLFFGLLLTGLLLKDPAYLLLALSSLFYILQAMQARDVIPNILFMQSPIYSGSYKLMYFFDCLVALTLSLSGYFFSYTNKKRTSISKPMIAIVELIIIEILLIVTIDSPITLFLTCIIISIVERYLMVLGSVLNIKNSNTEVKVVFICWAAVLFFSPLIRILFLARNFAGLQLPEFINLKGLSSSTLGFVFLFIPPLYSIGKRFNVRYQYVQKEYQDLEIAFMEQGKLQKLKQTVSAPIAELASSVLNSACILSKLNFSAVNAEYVELIKRESAKINDLLVAVRVLDRTEELRETPILLLNFFNSCMLTIRRIASERNCSASLTTAIANDTIVMGDPRILQLLFIIPPVTIISLTKPNTKISIYIEENNNGFTMTVSNTFESEELDNPQRILQAFNEITFYDFINELGRVYNTSVDIWPSKDNCRITFNIHLDKIEDTSDIKVVTDKTTFEMSENSRRLFKDMEKQKNLQQEHLPENDELPAETVSVSLQSEEEKQTQPRVKDIFDQYNFSTREKEIATLIIEGNSDKEIAYKLNISPQTVATHNKKIFKKSGVHSRVELINKVR